MTVPQNVAVELKCTPYEMFDGDDRDYLPCHCPICGAFIKWDEHLKCTKCGAELIAIPERDEEDGTELEYGKICPISLKKQSKVEDKS